MTRTLYLVASAAPPLLRLGDGIEVLKNAGWRPCMILTPTAATWVDTDTLTRQCDGLLRVQPRLPHERDPLPAADAVLAAPVTFNLLNKWAAGISDTLAAGILNEALGLDIPVLAATVIKRTLQRHPAYESSITTLARAGVDMLPPNSVVTTASNGSPSMDWNQILQRLDTAR